MAINVREARSNLSWGVWGGAVSPPPQWVEGRTLVEVLGAKAPKNFDIYRQKDVRCCNFKFNLNIFEEYFYVHFVIILVGIDATC